MKKSKTYVYTLLKVDGTREQVDHRPTELPLKYMYRILDCDTVQTVPRDYVPTGIGIYTRPIIYVDENGRFKDLERNPFFNVLKDANGGEWDVIGNALMEEIMYEE